MLSSPAFATAAAALLRSTTPPSAVLSPPRFAPDERYRDLKIPQFVTVGDLAAWLGESVPRLEWFADERRTHAATAIPMFQNYRYRFIRKASGSHRLLEAPKSQLQAMQHCILREILDCVPPHDAAHGFVRGRSCATGAALHASEAIVACADLRDFFGAVAARRVHTVFRKLGYPWGVARILTGLCCTSTPMSVFTRAPRPADFDWESRKRLGAPHLPQGSPTSPSLANLVAAPLDSRLAGLADRFGAGYTRYADDLTFSGDEAFAKRVSALLRYASEIAADEGFAFNAAKTRIMRRGARQRVTGLVVNSHINVERSQYDALKATLHNCATTGPAGQNRDHRSDFAAHLAGKVAWVEGVNPPRGAKLRAIYDRIDWT